MSDFELNRDWLRKQQSPFFVYDLERIADNVAFLRSRWARLNGGRFRIYYSVKANPHGTLLQTLAKAVDGFDVSSLAELEEVLRLGVSADRITVSGPAKTDALLRKAVAASVHALHLDSEEEIQALQTIDPKGRVPATLRLQSSPKAFKLGFPPAQIEKILAASSEGRWAGFHCYLGRESFSAAEARDLIQRVRDLRARFSSKFSPHFALFFGPGLPNRDLVGAGDPEFDLPFDTIDFPVHVEGGRYFVMNAGLYGAPILSVKADAGPRPLVIIDGGIHHLNGPLISPTSPQKTVTVKAYRDGSELSGENAEHLLFGSLCLGNDLLHSHLPLPKGLRRGDWLVFSPFGSYNVTASAHAFIGQNLPTEWARQPGGEPRLISSASFRLYQDSF
jgi:diaminopimelate decarboxylase